MNRILNLLAWGAVAVVAALAVLNWSTLTTPAQLDLVIAQVQAPLGVVLLGVTAVLAALFLFTSLQNQIGSLLETRRLFKEVKRVQDLADKAEASRIESLHEHMATEFRQLNERLASIGAGAGGSGEGRQAASNATAEIVALGERERG